MGVHGIVEGLCSKTRWWLIASRGKTHYVMMSTSFTQWRLILKCRYVHRAWARSLYILYILHLGKLRPFSSFRLLNCLSSAEKKVKCVHLRGNTHHSRLVNGRASVNTTVVCTYSGWGTSSSSSSFPPFSLFPAFSSPF